MKADSELIRWLLDQVNREKITKYQISKITGVHQTTLTNLENGTSLIENLSFRAASSLTEYTEKIEEERKMEKTYKEWRETLQELLDEGNPGSSDCGEVQVRKDFSEYAGLDCEITFEKMLELEENYEKEQRNMLKIIYTDTTDNNKRYIVAEITTNHSMTIDQALELAGVNMDDWARQQGWDGYDYESLTMEVR